jgi:RNA polymerase sigma-70 factor (ECF subfamily)
MPPQTPEHVRWFTEEVQPHERSLRAYLQAAAPNPADVEDLLQESYLRLLRVRSSAPIQCVRALLFAIARNAVRDAVREKLANREIPSTEIDAFPVLDDSADVVDLVARRQEQALLAEAMRALPERCREVLILRKIHGLSQRDIAHKLGISENTVESLVSRGVRRCANHLRWRVREQP